MKKSLLQKITDLLEEGGLRVSGINTYPPDKDGLISVSLEVQKEAGLFALSRAESSVRRFVSNRIIFNESACENVDIVYSEYLKFASKINIVHTLGKSSFIRFIIRNYPGYKMAPPVAKQGEAAKKWVFLNMRLLLPGSSEFHCVGKGAGDCGDCEYSGTCPGSFENQEPDKPEDGETDPLCETHKTPSGEYIPPKKENPCSTCAIIDCENCPINTGDPVKLYTANQAIIAMVREGKTLRHLNGKRVKFFPSSCSFSFIDDLGASIAGGELKLKDFSELYGEVGKENV